MRKLLNAFARWLLKATCEHRFNWFWQSAGLTELHEYKHYYDDWKVGICIKSGKKLESDGYDG